MGLGDRKLRLTAAAEATMPEYERFPGTQKVLLNLLLDFKSCCKAALYPILFGTRDATRGPIWAVGGDGRIGFGCAMIFLSPFWRVVA